MRTGRATRQRQAILRTLETAAAPLSPGEVQARASVSVPRLGIATVYRTLKGLVEEGAVVSVLVPGTAPRYEVASLVHHHHFRCSDCDGVFELEGCPRNLRALVPSGFEVQGHDLWLFGRCNRCVADQPAAPGSA